MENALFWYNSDIMYNDKEGLPDKFNAETYERIASVYVTIFPF